MRRYKKMMYSRHFVIIVSHFQARVTFVIFVSHFLTHVTLSLFCSIFELMLLRHVCLTFLDSCDVVNFMSLYLLMLLSPLPVSLY